MTRQSAAIGIIANPVSGRDIRRVAARGAVSSTEDKRNRIARAAVGAVAGGCKKIVAMKEPFGIASKALEDLPVDADIEILDIGARVDPTDTARAALAMKALGIKVLITLGGDGTNRTIAKSWPDVTLVPMSTGTNNVFPSQIEPTVAGAAAGLVASENVDEEIVAPRSKMIHLDFEDGRRDLALIDAATLANDFAGNHMPVDPNNLRQLLVSVARSDTIGVSSIAGLHTQCRPEDDLAVLVTCGQDGKLTNAPIAPGLYRKVPVEAVTKIELDQQIELWGPSTLAFDGDREHDVPANSRVLAIVRRDGPKVVNVRLAMEAASHSGLFVEP